VIGSLIPSVQLMLWRQLTLSPVGSGSASTGQFPVQVFDHNDKPKPFAEHIHLIIDQILKLNIIEVTPLAGEPFTVTSPKKVLIVDMSALASASKMRSCISGMWWSLTTDAVQKAKFVRRGVGRVYSFFGSRTRKRVNDLLTEYHECAASETAAKQQFLIGCGYGANPTFPASVDFGIDNSTVDVLHSMTADKSGWLLDLFKLCDYISGDVSNVMTKRLRAIGLDPRKSTTFGRTSIKMNAMQGRIIDALIKNTDEALGGLFDIPQFTPEQSRTMNRVWSLRPFTTKARMCGVSDCRQLAFFRAVGAVETKLGDIQAIMRPPGTNEQPVAAVCPGERGSGQSGPGS
jgi:hypothetical protein